MKAEGARLTWVAMLIAALAMPFLIFSWGTLVHRGPSLQIEGHYVPLERLGEPDSEGTRWASLGVGTTQTLRLSESLIPEHLGQLGADSDGGLYYRHEAAHRGALISSPTGRTSTTDRGVAFLTLPEGPGARILLGEGSDAPSVLSQVCSSAGNSGSTDGVAWARAEILAAEGIWVPDSRGEMRVLLIPMEPGAHRHVGDATLLTIPSETGELEAWLVRGRHDPDSCDPSCQTALKEADGALNLASWFGGVSETLEDGIRQEPGFESEERGGIVRVIKPRAWIRVGDHAARPLLPGGQDDSQFALGDSSVEVFQRSAGEETTAQAIRPLREFGEGLAHRLKAPASVRVARSSSTSPPVRVFDCESLASCVEDGDGCPDQQAGLTALTSADWLVAGNGVHYRAQVEGPSEVSPEGALALALEVPPAGRARLFASLAASRFKAYNLRIPVERCDSGATLLRGMTDEQALPDDVEASTARFTRGEGEELASLPLPGWMAKLHPDIQDEGRTGVDIARVCAAQDGTLEVDDQLGIVQTSLAASAASVSSGGTLRVAGHTLRYSARQPVLEQVVPLWGFVLAVLVGAVLILRRLALTARREKPPTALVAGVLGVGLLMVTGGLLQMHMAASDSLLGASDYVHRHLITGWFALITLGVAVELGSLRVEGEDGWDRTYRALRAASIGVLALAVHASVDLVVWRTLGPPGDQVLAGDMVRAGVVAFLIKVWVTGLVLVGLTVATSRVLNRSPRPRGAWQRAQDWGEEFRLRWDHTWLHLSSGNALGDLDGNRMWGAIAWSLNKCVSWGLRPDLALQAGLTEHIRESRHSVRAFFVWLVTRGWELLFRRPVAYHTRKDAFGVGWLLIALAIMAIGAAYAWLKGSARALGGFDLKPSEFTAVLVGLGFGGMLAGFSRELSAKRWFVPARALSWAVALEAVLILLYGVRADLGPLMVVVPAVLLLLFVWSFEWHPGDGGAARRRVAYRFAISCGLVVLTAGGAFGVLMGLEALQDTVTELPLVGSSLSRGLDRMGTYTQSWYTTPGWWTTRGQWIAAGYYNGREVYLSNLHSDLAYTALIQSFGPLRALLVLGLYGGVVASLFALGERLVHGAGRIHQTLVGIYDQDISIGLRDILVRDTEAQARRLASVGYLAFFSGAYLAMEVVVHIGTCFNTTLQTGITLPWVSSGGSAAVGFALLVGLSLGLGATALRQLPTTTEGWKKREEGLLAAAKKELTGA